MRKKMICSWRGRRENNTGSAATWPIPYKEIVWGLFRLRALRAPRCSTYQPTCPPWESTAMTYDVGSFRPAS
ncbi:Uncharacterized protein HZ326_11343 [Fusarium oxysporum f. sp. albedinis]|nr:Uncharacterized protein HZ326_11343 [Fusarium oxysporum f. sp. albedinis]